MADRERLLSRRYQMQRILTQGQISTVYLAFDQVLQRAVVIKIIPPEHMAVYKASIGLTAQFSHANIIGTYDLIQGPDALYLVQEYVEGDSFSSLLQTQLSPYAVADFGMQVCQALLYAGGSARGVCHGDLTPSTIIRDRRGLVRINNFTLPSDVQYFASWSHVGGNGVAVSDTELPWGQISDGRRADDTRAVGLLLYQLLSGRPAGAVSVEPPADGRLRFLRNVPIELCEVIARTVVVQHPQHIQTPEVLYEALQQQVEAFELAAEAAPVQGNQREDNLRVNAPVGSQGLAGAEKLVTALPMRESGQGGTSLSTFQSEANPPMVPMEQQGQRPQFVPPTTDVPPGQQSSYAPQTEAHPALRLSIPLLILFGLVVFIAFFIIGYFVAHIVL